MLLKVSLWCKGHEPCGAGVTIKSDGVCVCVIERDVCVASAVMKYKVVFHCHPRASRSTKGTI